MNFFPLDAKLPKAGPVFFPLASKHSVGAKKYSMSKSILETFEDRVGYEHSLANVVTSARIPFSLDLSPFPGV